MGVRVSRLMIAIALAVWSCDGARAEVHIERHIEPGKPFLLSDGTTYDAGERFRVNEQHRLPEDMVVQGDTVVLKATGDGLDRATQARWRIVRDWALETAFGGWRMHLAYGAIPNRRRNRTARCRAYHSFLARVPARLRLRRPSGMVGHSFSAARFRACLFGTLRSHISLKSASKPSSNSIVVTPAVDPCMNIVMP